MIYTEEIGRIVENEFQELNSRRTPTSRYETLSNIFTYIGKCLENGEPEKARVLFCQQWAKINHFSKEALLDTDIISYAQKYYEMSGFKTQKGFGSTLELFVSNGKGDDGVWVEVSENEILNSVTDYFNSISERIADEYAHFEMDKPVSDEQEEKFVIHSLQNGTPKEELGIWLGYNRVDEIIEKHKKTINDATKARKQK